MMWSFTKVKALSRMHPGACFQIHAASFPIVYTSNS